MKDQLEVVENKLLLEMADIEMKEAMESPYDPGDPRESPKNAFPEDPGTEDKPPFDALWLEGKGANGEKMKDLVHLLLTAADLSFNAVKSFSRSRRGGILVKFDNPESAAAALKSSVRLQSVAPELKVFTPRIQTDFSVVAINIPVSWPTEELPDVLIPAPVKASRLMRKSSDGFVESAAVRLFYKSQSEMDLVLAKGIRQRDGYLFFRVRPYVKAPQVFCRRCKKVGRQHAQCDVVCAHCSGAHPASQCPSQSLKCPECDEPHSLYSCPSIRDRKSQAVRSRISSKSYRDVARAALPAPRDSVPLSTQQMVPLEAVAEIVTKSIVEVLKALNIHTSDASAVVSSVVQKETERVLSGLSRGDAFAGRVASTSAQPRSRSRSKSPKHLDRSLVSVRCSRCGEALLQRNLKRHLNQYCKGAPSNDATDGLH